MLKLSGVEKSKYIKLCLLFQKGLLLVSAFVLLKRPLQHYFEIFLLKELRSFILRTILVWSLFYAIRVVYTGMYFLSILLENQFFFFFLRFLCFLLVLNSTYLHKLFKHLYNHYLYSRCQVLCFFVLTYHFSVKQFVRTDITVMKT